MLRLMTIVLFSLFLQTSFAQNQRVKRIFKNNDTCNALQIFSALNNFPEYKRLYLLDEYRCIKEEKLQLKQGVTWFSFPRFESRDAQDNENTPYINPYQNKIYIPNGGHSNVSVVDFEADEPLELRAGEGNEPGITWISIPRHTRPNDPELTPTPIVFDQNNISGGYNWLNLRYNYIDFGSFENNFVDVEWNNNVWNYDNNIMTNIKSTRGYKLKLYPNDAKVLVLRGHLEYSSTQMQLVGNQLENWLGYWLYEEQSPFDAIPSDILEHLTYMKTQDWFCGKEYGEGSQNSYWVCGVILGKTNITLKYADMIILKSDDNISNFQWQYNSVNSNSEIKEKAQYFQYSEQQDYTPFFIELDSVDKPQEIGAFCNDSCIGATSVLPNDTIVLVPAYSDTVTNEITFREYYGGSKSKKPEIKEYFIKSRYGNNWKKGTVNIDKKQDFYHISFKEKWGKKSNNTESFITLIDVYPNPAKKNLTIGYRLLKTMNIFITLYDYTGKKIFETEFINNSAGNYKYNYNLEDKQVKSGIYIIKIAGNNESHIRKIAVN